MRQRRATPIIITVLFLFLTAWPVWGTNYYVANNGSDSNSGTSTSAPWATTAKVQMTVKNGDTVYFHGGDSWSSTTGCTVLVCTTGVTYDGITWGNGSRAVFNATSSMTGTNGTAVIIDYVNGVTLRGIEINGGSYYNYGIDVGNYAKTGITGATIDNCYIHHVGSSTDAANNRWPYGIIIGCTSGVTSNVSIVNTEVAYCARTGINIYPSWTTYNNEVRGVLIKNCYVHNNGINCAAGAIDIANYVNGLTLEYCTFSNNSGACIALRTSADYPANIVYGPTGVTIRNNIIKSNGIYGLWMYDAVGTSEQAEVYNNLFIDNGCTLNGSTAATGNGAELFIQNGKSASHAFKIYNNTFYQKTNPNRNWSGIILVGLNDTAATGSTIELKNNIIYAGINSSDSTYRPIWDRWNQIAHSNNLIYRSSGSTLLTIGTTSYTSTYLSTWEPTAQNTIPSFKGGSLPSGFSKTIIGTLKPNTDFFAITSGNALGKGATLGSPYNTCINSATYIRPTAGYDIGAYQYTALPSTPQGLKVSISQ